jgi:hypothetical protein
MTTPESENGAPVEPGQPAEPEQPAVPTKVCPHCGTQSQTAADKCPNCGKPYRQKRGGCLKWVGISLLVLVLLIAGCTALIASSGDDNDDSSTPAAAGETDAGEETPDEPEGIDDGTYRVPNELAAGTYRSTGDSTCYWARLKGFSGELSDVIANGNNSPEIVAVGKKDAGFETRGCGDWVPAKETAPASPAGEFGDGTYQVGVHIRPGTYRADGSGTCYWARLSNFTHDGVNGVITNGNNPTTIEISASDAGFTTFGCGTWSR